jgi:hypothetical protein
MYITSNLEEAVFNAPYIRGFRKLSILSGYASSAFLVHILDRYPDIEIDLIIGMSKQDGIKRWDHERYLQIMNDNPRISISYRTSLPPVHTKIYHWHKYGLFHDSVTFVGSANFSWGGFRDQGELLVEANHSNIDEVYNISDVVSCSDPSIGQLINFYNFRIQRRSQTLQGISQEGTKETASINLENLEFVDLPLLLKNDTLIHEKSGLNWGQRPGREPNQAYIPVKMKIHLDHPNFFPPLEQTFTMLTDDRKQLMCVMAQANRKAIHTSENNSIMGRYFRERLGVAFGASVNVQDVVNYGRTSVRVYKIDDETYFMDFGV